MVGEQNDSISTEEKIDDLKREMELLHRDITRRNQEMMGAITVLCLPMSTKSRLEVGFNIIKGLPDSILREIFGRYIKEGIKSEMNFDQLIEPMINVLGFDRVWKIIPNKLIGDQFGEYALHKWIDMGKTLACEK